MDAKTFKIGKLSVVFTPQDDQTRAQELGETWEKIEFIPNNADGSYKNFLLGQFNPQERTAAINAGIRFLMSPPKHRHMHFHNQFHPDRKAGLVGWIHFSELNTQAPTTTLKIDGKPAIVQSPYVKNAANLPSYTATSEWLTLKRVTESFYRAMNDNRTTLAATGVPSGSLLHGFMADLYSGVTLIVYPVVTRRNNDGNPQVFGGMQDKAKWLFATLSAIEAGELTLENAAHQYFTNALFFRISREDMARMEANGTADAEISKQVREDAKSYVTTGEVAPRGKEILVNSEPVDVALIPTGRWWVYVGSEKRMGETLSVVGRDRILQLVNKHNGQVRLETYEA